MLPSIHSGRSKPPSCKRGIATNLPQPSLTQPPSNSRDARLGALDFTSSFVSLRGRHVTSDILSMVVDALSTSAVLAGLELGDNPLIGDEGIKVLTQLVEACPTLSYLGLSRTGLTQWGLETLTIADQKNNALKVVDLSSNADLDDGACAVLSKWLASSSSMRELKLFDTGIGPKGATRLMEGVASCPTFTVLRLPHHVGQHVQQEIDGLLTERIKARERAELEAAEERRKHLQGGLSSASATVWVSQPPPISPRLRQAEGGVLTSGLGDWGNSSSRGALACLSLLETKSAQRALSQAEASKRAAILALGSRDGTPRGQRPSHLAPISPRNSLLPQNNVSSTRRPSQTYENTLGAYFARMQ